MGVVHQVFKELAVLTQDGHLFLDVLETFASNPKNEGSLNLLSLLNVASEIEKGPVHISWTVESSTVSEVLGQHKHIAIEDVFLASHMRVCLIDLLSDSSLDKG